MKKQLQIIRSKDKVIYYQNERGGKVHSLIITMAYDSILENEAINQTLEQIIPNAHRAWWN